LKGGQVAAGSLLGLPVRLRVLLTLFVPPELSHSGG
jgi:hypothetical protein